MLPKDFNFSKKTNQPSNSGNNGKKQSKMSFDFLLNNSSQNDNSFDSSTFFDEPKPKKRKLNNTSYINLNKNNNSNLFLNQQPTNNLNSYSNINTYNPNFNTSFIPSFNFSPSDNISNNNNSKPLPPLNQVTNNNPPPLINFNNNIQPNFLYPNFPLPSLNNNNFNQPSSNNNSLFINKTPINNTVSNKPQIIKPIVQKLVVPPKKYDFKNDFTLTKQQAKTGQFKGPSNFRSPSNATTLNYNSGYHESALVTDQHDKVQKELNKNNNNTTFKFKYDKKGWKGNKNFVLNTNTTKTVLNLGDGFRTDTAQTVLSAQNNKGAGHTGSNMKTTGQDGAHDLLRKPMFNIMQQQMDDQQGITKNSIATLMSAITVNSMAPAKIANTVAFGSNKKSLKAKHVQKEYEKRRNLSKVRLDKMFEKLDDKEKDYVLKNTEQFLNSTKDSKNPNKRKLAPTRPRSPFRNPVSNSNDTFQGGDYIDLNNNTQNLTLDNISSINQYDTNLDPPDDSDFWGHFLTQPFRTERDRSGSKSKKKKSKKKNSNNNSING